MLELAQWIMLGGVATCGLLSLWPFALNRRWKSWNLYLPVPAVLLYGGYEQALPAEINIAPTMAVLLPMLVFILLNGMAKVGVLVHLWRLAGRSRRRLRELPQRSWQLAAALPLAVVCAAWSWFLRP